MNTVDDKNNFNTENSKTSNKQNKQNTVYMLSENNFAIPNTLNQQLVEALKMIIK